MTILRNILALIVGFVGATLSLMACVGRLTENSYARVLVALAVAFVIPLVVADRLLPDDPKRARGLVSDEHRSDGLFLLNRGDQSACPALHRPC